MLFLVERSEKVGYHIIGESHAKLFANVASVTEVDSTPYTRFLGLSRRRGETFEALRKARRLQPPRRRPASAQFPFAFQPACVRRTTRFVLEAVI
jgi:hypothetical protein